MTILIVIAPDAVLDKDTTDVVASAAFILFRGEYCSRNPESLCSNR